jgi:NDP-sugar pyrophosphorylase family protein
MKLPEKMQSDNVQLDKVRSIWMKIDKVWSYMVRSGEALSEKMQSDNERLEHSDVHLKSN